MGTLSPSAAALISKYGIAAVFAGTFIEGETVLLAAGIVAGAGLLNPLSVWASASLGAWAGHVFWFFAGRIFGNRYILPKSNWIRVRFAEVNRIVLERPKTAVFILQYLYGMRIIGAVAIGITEMSFRKFMLYEALNCMLWAALILGAGYILEESIMRIFHGWLAWLWLGVSVAAVILFIRHLERTLSRKRLK
ncbi:MAG: DedA family protein [Deferribacteres bacterium]|nr:DedA family protein [Deferribacteres bacterium]